VIAVVLAIVEVLVTVAVLANEVALRTVEVQALAIVQPVAAEAADRLARVETVSATAASVVQEEIVVEDLEEVPAVLVDQTRGPAVVEVLPAWVAVAAVVVVLAVEVHAAAVVVVVAVAAEAEGGNCYEKQNYDNGHNCFQSSLR
jgi:hypothetical protein